VAALQTFAKSVNSVVPGGFPSYVRVFHPAYLNGVHVRWSEIAAANGTHAHAGMQLGALTGHASFDGSRHQHGVYDQSPREGSLPRDVAETLAQVLARHTETPERCWFAIWYGFGGTPDDVRRAPIFKVPHRQYHLLLGPVDADVEDVMGFNQSANIWWPDDRAWCVATEIDFKSTYIGCSEACRDELAASPDLEAFPIDPAAGITFDSDRINPEPARAP
jgi:hypothetical protein